MNTLPDQPFGGQLQKQIHLSALVIELYDFIKQFGFPDARSDWYWAVAYKIRHTIRKLSLVEHTTYQDIQMIRTMVHTHARVHVMDVDNAFSEYFDDRHRC